MKYSDEEKQRMLGNRRGTILVVLGYVSVGAACLWIGKSAQSVWFWIGSLLLLCGLFGGGVMLLLYLFPRTTFRAMERFDDEFEKERKIPERWFP